MPNDCWNNLTITGVREEIDRFVANEFIGAPAWAYTIQHRGVEGIQFRLWSSSFPDYVWLEGLLVRYNTLWIKNVWQEEGGRAGIWVGGVEKGIRHFEWEDLCLEEKAHRFRQSAT